MYWSPKIHETPVGARFIVASYYYITNPLSDKISKMIFNTVESFHKKVYFIAADKGNLAPKQFVIRMAMYIVEMCEVILKMPAD